MKKLLCLILMQVSTYAARESAIQQIKEGNLSLPSSQQPGPLFSFGQNIIDKGLLQGYAAVGDLVGKNSNFALFVPSILYACRDDLSLFITLPISIKNKVANQCSAGFNDIAIYVEYSPYDHNTFTSDNQITVIGGTTLPTGSPYKTPATSVGPSSFFFGATASHLDPDWYYFVDTGVSIIPPACDESTNTTFFYQFAFGRNIAYKSEEMILSWLIEFNGGVDGLLRVNGINNTTIEGNILAIGPSLWFSTERFILQAGFSVPCVQQISGTQNTSQFLGVVSLGWTFN